MADVEYNKYLPPYRSLLNPNAKYDYKTHSLVPLLPLELTSIVARFQANQQKPKGSLNMKYRSLLSDVSRKALKLLMKVTRYQTLRATQTLWLRCTSFSQLPLEIQIWVFTLVGDTAAYRACLLASKRFYGLAKPFLYHDISFTLTYRLAQFVTCLRLNPQLGTYVVSVDVLQLKPGNYEWELQRDEHDDGEWDDDVVVNTAAVLASWRDWKFKNNPLYALHPAPPVPLAKTLTNASVSLAYSQKRAKLSKYFRRRSHASALPATPHLHQLHPLPHPRINRFLMNYSLSKDVPVGYVLHLIALCPNLRLLNMGSLSLSTDYQLQPLAAHKYQVYDLMNNYHKDLLKIVDAIAPMQLQVSANPFLNHPHVRLPFDAASALLLRLPFDSSGLLVFSINTFSKPIRKYNSLLPPNPPSVTGMLYLHKGDGKIYLSDLNLKAINTAHLLIVLESDVLHALALRTDTLRSVNLSSLIWLSARLVREYLLKLLALELRCASVDGKEYVLYRNRHFVLGEPLDADEDAVVDTRGSPVMLDLTDLGMHKNLPWAQRIDSRTRKGQRLIHRILNDELVLQFEEYLIRERVRRGRIGENYFS